MFSISCQTDNVIIIVVAYAHLVFILKNKSIVVLFFFTFTKIPEKSFLRKKSFTWLTVWKLTVQE